MFLFSCSQPEKNYRFVHKIDTGITFTNELTKSPELNILNYLYYYNGAGVATGDFNNDGLIDIYFTSNLQQDHLYLNLGDLKFKNIFPRIRAFTAHIHSNWVSPVKKRRIILTGSEKSVIYDNIDVDKLKIYDTGNIGTDYNQNQLGDVNIPKINTTEALRNGFLHFSDCIQKRSQPRTNLQRARKILSWVL